MNLVVLDLEMNQPSEKIIQIGAVQLDLAANTIDHFFDEITNPGERPDSFITRLTGISKEDVEAAMSLRKALILFWRKFKQAPVARRLASWGDDVNWIVEASQNLGVTVPDRIQAYDLKNLVRFFRSAKGESVRKGVGLRNVLRSLDIEFEGRHHNAYDDARMTAKIIQALYQDLKIFYSD